MTLLAQTSENSAPRRIGSNWHKTARANLTGNKGSLSQATCSKLFSARTSSETLHAPVKHAG